VPAPTRTPRNEWIEEGLRALGVGGPDAVRIENLAVALGVTKGGFYWHFKGRMALLEEMLDTWEELVTDDVIVRVEAGGGDPEAKLRRLFALAVSVEGLLKIELAIREWARREPAVAKRLQRVDNRRAEYLRSLFRGLTSDETEIEVRSYLAMAIFVGNPFVLADHGRLDRSKVLAEALEKLLVSSPG
jgi:AcrR family transcriptional regulator